MKSKKIFTGLVLAFILLAIPQVIAQASDMQGTYSGIYKSTSHKGIEGYIQFTIDSNDNLDGTMMIRGLNCNINLTFLIEHGNREVYRGIFTRKIAIFTWEYEMVMDLEPVSETKISGHIRIPGLRFEATFIAENLM